ncbi:DUF1553 domain-containing protein [Phycisphaeraceae bacterium D3-23]
MGLSKRAAGLFALVYLGAGFLTGCGGEGPDARVDGTASFTHVVQASGQTEAVSYNRDIRPILSDKCFTCHGPDAAAREADLRLDRPDDGDDYFGALSVIEPGDSEASELVSRIHSTRSRLVMPPPASKLSLSEEEKALLSRWIEEGAGYEAHWSFVALPHEVALPDVSDGQWPRDSLDRFVLAGIESAGLSPSREASRERWLRRVTYDLTGLPPTPEEVAAFLTDAEPEAYERVVDRLLASPHYGERMATQWIDLARYADSYGYQSDQLSPTWHWRDWLVGAFNDNLPYDDFLTWQLAGDLLPDATREQKLATAFSRLHRMTNEGGSISEEWMNEYAADRLHTFGTAFMGLTFECARCHDHRYDPLEQREYYELYAFFNSIDEYGMYHDAGRVPTPSLLLPTQAEEARWNELRAAVAEAQQHVDDTVASRSGWAFEAWLARDNKDAEVPGLAGHYPLDELTNGNQLANIAAPDNPGSTNPANTIIEGHTGNALQFAGDADASFGNVCGGLQPHDAFTVAMWVMLPRDNMTGVLFHRTGGTDVGYHGTDLTLQDGQLRFAMMRFWPGNAIAVQTTRPLPVGRWVHVVVSYGATFDADGMAIHLDGQPASETLRDNLYKYPQHGGHGLTFDHRFRSPTVPGVAIDELYVYNRALSPIEARHLFDGTALAQALAAGDAEALRDYYLSCQDASVAEARAALVAAQRALLEHQTGLAEISVMAELPEARPAYLLNRGAYDAPQNDETRVKRDTPDALPAFPDAVPRDRLGLAQWLTSEDHPLTARVAVNRLWQVCFGVGLVATPENFGLQGAWPTHPELLDSLARDFIASGWDTKAMLRRIVLSATYRQDSAGNPRSYEQDPENLLHARGPSGRLSAEMIRDTALAAAGLIDLRLGGPPVSPYQPTNFWREANSMSPGYRQSVGGDLYRRSLYTVWKRTAPMPNMMAFDAPGREVCIASRSETNTPLQALVLLNDVQFVEACRVLAERTLAMESDDAAGITRMFQRVAGRAPDPREHEILLALLADARAHYAERPEDAALLRAQGTFATDDALDTIEVAAWTIVAQGVLNYDAAVWKR